MILIYLKKNTFSSLTSINIQIKFNFEKLILIYTNFNNCLYKSESILRSNINDDNYSISHYYYCHFYYFYLFNIKDRKDIKNNMNRNNAKYYGAQALLTYKTFFFQNLHVVAFVGIA